MIGPEPEPSSLEIRSEELTVRLRPEKGCDISSIIDNRSGVDLLFKTPWTPHSGPHGYHGSSAEAWLQSYGGGWQLILPNGGAPSSEHGTEWGFHGEAALVPWTVVATDPTCVELETRLFRSPLTVWRRIEVHGPRLAITERVSNTSPLDLEIMWGHHPAFGAPFLEGGTLLSVPAESFVVDEEQPGTLLAPGSRHPWPVVRTTSGDAVDLSIIPPPSEERAVLGYLEGLSQPFFAFTNPHLRLGIAVRWELELFDRAWFWQESHHESGFPFFKRAYVTAVEPYTTTPGQQGIGRARERGAPLLRLGPGEVRQTEIEAVVFHSDRRVREVKKGGHIEFVRG